MKSHASTLLEVAARILKDVAARCSALESAHRDLDTLRSRFKHEGISFFTITLPSFGSDFERSLDQGYIDPKHFRSFGKCGQIPAFLQGIVGQVFDADTGRIFHDPPSEAIRGVRQIAYTFKKLKMDCTPKRVAAAFLGFVQDEHDLQEAIPDKQRDQFISVSNMLWNWLDWDPLLRPLSCLPKHGPGATAEHITGNGKYVFSSWHDRLEPYFPLTSNAFACASAWESKEFEAVTIVSEEQELPVRVITVPKTLKAPRIIAIEPVCMQYTQQALSQALVRALETRIGTTGHLNFSDQSINQRLALMSSQTGELATLDLSSASDRVDASLVYDMLGPSPDFRDAVFACRSKTAQLPTGELIHLKKFASMGSALCFPIESMYFYTLCVGALLEKHDLPVTSRNIFSMSRNVYVYGDDILVPAIDADFVISYLHKYHCKVNMSKSFWTGRFRESCGMDAFNGTCVTPTYLRSLPPDDKQSASELISWVATANLLRKEGYYRTSDYLFKIVERIIGSLPTIQDNAACLGRISENNCFTIERWNSQLQRPEVRAWMVSPVYRDDRLEGYPALLKCFLSLESRRSKSLVLSGETEHLLRTVRSGAVALKRRWLQPY